MAKTRPTPKRPAEGGAGRGATSITRGPGELRIIGGQWRRRRLPIVAVEGLRPTSDRVRETLFNWLGQYLSGLRCLDLFAGSGALGLEAASRGAATVALVEADPRAARQLLAHCATLHAGPAVRVLQGDALQFLLQPRLLHGPDPSPDADPAPAFDVVFLDPPYALGLLPHCLAALPPLLAPDARVYIEDAAPLLAPEGWELLREDRAGRVHYGLLRCTLPASAWSTPAPSTP
ncbi:MAG: 16S rRNA (guanine(966)-N(2))-methyltransferase RsmD [Rhodocyclaceae bacterium]|nr:16S rRNA (guanine(966)-N(2))-methyltransferase RsmD [Rhodocyclaceae bacterium]